MTYVLNTTDHPYTALPTARIAARAAMPAKRFLTAMVHSLISLPSAIGTACAMIYVAPYQSSEQHKDHSDPQNF